MKILLFSDSHGDLENMIRVLGQHSDADGVFHLGDGEEDFLGLRSIYPQLLFLGVRGNCDWQSKGAVSDRFVYGDKLIFLTHGHIFGTKTGTIKLTREGRKMGADLVLYGHTHKAKIDRLDGLTLMNPGSIHRNSDHPSYGIINLGDTLDVKIVYL